jgi:toxin ParE1/3/4
MQTRLLDEARSEFLDEIRYYEKIQTGLGKRFRIATTEAFRRAGESPQLGKPGAAGTRRILVRGFPFAVIYAAFPDEVVIYAVAHMSREPEYWRNRARGAE